MTLRKAARHAHYLALCLSLPACAADVADDFSDSSEIEEKNASLSAPINFLVVYKLESVPTSAAADIKKAGGSVLATYKELGLVLASSASSSFQSTLAKSPLVQAVAPTQGSAVDSLPSESAEQKARPPAVSKASGDTLAPMQWNMQQIHAPQARAITAGKKSVVVGVFDSGIDDKLPDLKGQVDRSKSVTCIGGVADTSYANWSFDAIGHGSHVAGIIGAKENGVGTVGIAPGATLAAVKLTEDGFIYPEAFICGLYWAATHDFDLVNASLFIDPYYFNCKSDPTQRAITIAEQRAVKFAALKGVTVIAAASNEQIDLANPTEDPFSPTNGETVPRTVDNSCKLLPVELDGVIGVSAVAGDKKLAYYSNYGLGVVDISAPGGDFHVPMPGNESGQIVSPLPAYSYYYQAAIDWNGRVAESCADGREANDPNSDGSTCKGTYAALQGTSQAAPHVTGVAALAISRFGKMSAPLLLAALTRGATQTACPSGLYQPYPEDMPAEKCQGPKLYNGFYGVGVVDALGTVR
ncbi:MAG TPA: S8 family serine peptidase [Polyangiales bacterium]|nr:S8 family serine peptidase [Polyangiales bacterium]